MTDEQSMPQLPSFWMPRPAPDATDGEIERFDALLQRATAAGLRAIRVHDPRVVLARAAADPDGFPWLDEP